MNEFTTLKQLPSAKRELKSQGYEIYKANLYINGRQAYKVIKESEGVDLLCTDYQLLDYASFGIVLNEYYGG